MSNVDQKRDLVHLAIQDSADRDSFSVHISTASIEVVRESGRLCTGSYSFHVGGTQVTSAYMLLAKASDIGHV